MALDDWPEPDRDWAGRYLLGLFREGVEASASSERQVELIAAVHAAGVPAEELFGDPADVARADAPDLAGPSAVAAAESADRAGARDAVGYAGAALLLLGVIAAIMVLVSGDGPIDVRVGVVAVLLAIIGGLIIGVGEKLSEIYIGPMFGGGIEIWFAYVLALVFLLVRPQGLFGEKIIDRV